MTSPRFHATRRRNPAGLFCLALIALAACSGPSPSRPARAVILISVDTLRSDHLPAYGYQGIQTPSLDAFRRDAVLYERAYSNCPLTLPSHATMLTGLMPGEHGIRDNLGFRLRGDATTLAEAMKSAGYRTGAAVSAFVLRREAGLDKGFDFYDDAVRPIDGSDVLGRVQRDGAQTVAAAQRWIDGLGEQPFFLFLHLYEPHSPYVPSYDGEIEKVDRIVGRLIDDLRRRGLYDDALIVLTSDHGEGLKDHGEEEHGIFLYREALQVPLLIKLPAGRGGGTTVNAPVQLADLFSMIADAANVPAPKRQPRAIYAETWYPRLHLGWSDLHSLIEGDRHYIHGPAPELFDTRSDAAERANLVESERRTYARMKTAIAPFIAEAAAPQAVDAEEAAKLAALGYLGSSAGAAGEDLPDPKSRMEDLQRLRAAFTAADEQRHDEALRLSAEVLEANPRIVDLWDLRAKSLAALGRYDEAIAASKEGLRIAPSSVGLIVTVASLSLLTGDLDTAQQHAELLRKLEPAAALVSLGGIAKERGQLDLALRHLDDALRHVAGREHVRIPNLHLYRGDVLARLGRPDEAERELRTEIAQYPQQPEAYASLVVLLVSRGRVEEATQLIRELVRRVPTPAGYYAAAETLQAIGDDRGSRYWARQGLQRFPGNEVLQAMGTAAVPAAGRAASRAALGWRRGTPPLQPARTPALP